MKVFVKLLLMSVLLLTVITPLAAQDSTNDIALQMIAEAAASQATSLSLSNLGLTAVPEEIGWLTQLEELYLTDNALTEMPPAIMNLTNLRVLDISNNNFHVIPFEIYQLRNLERLTLYYNHVNYVSYRIERLTNLQFLGLSANSLETLPPEIGKLTNLAELHLEINNIWQLPSEIGNLQQLCIFHVSDNELIRLPNELGQVTRLADPDCPGMILANNPLVSPPAGVVREGTGAVLAYLRGEDHNRLDDWVLTRLANIAVVILVGIGFIMFQRAASGKGKRKR
jgi:internalin A